MTVRLAMGTVAAAAALVVLTGCGTSPSAGPQVASVQGGNDSTATGTAVAAAPSTGIQQRLDDTPQRENELLAAYEGCLHDHGAPGIWVPQLRYWKVDLGPGKVTAAELQACESKKPIPPPELDPTKNPHYAQDVQADAQCARDHGISITIGPDGWWMPTDPNQPNINTVARQCLVQSFRNG